MGNTLKESFQILSSDDKIQIAHKHPSFNKDVIYYKDKANKVYVYYDSISTKRFIQELKANFADFKRYAIIISEKILK